jgi:hypothetical protein
MRLGAEGGKRIIVTFDAEGWCITTCVHQTTKEDGNVCDLALFEDRRILALVLATLMFFV